jgi:Ca2+-binding EF-hand superfamily protein
MAKDAEEAETIRTVFREWDTDGSQTISRDELEVVMKQLCGHFSPADIEMLMNEADTNGNGVIDIDEFVTWLTKPAAQSSGAALYNYSAVFKPLFEIYESKESGVITKESFEEIHCIMQGALRLAPCDEDAKRVDPLDLQKDHDEAFAEADKSGDGSITYRAFVDWMKDHIPDNMSKAELEKFVGALVNSMQGLQRVIKMAEQGQLSDDEDGGAVLMQFLEKLANSTRSFHEAVEAKATGAEENHWSEPPVGLNVEKLKALHMKLNPLNVRQVDKSVFEVLVLPMPGTCEESGKRTWCGEVVRRITYKSGKLKVEMPSYYVFQHENYSWIETCKCAGADKFDVGLKGLAPELGLFCLLKTEANFGTKLSWAGILNALEGGVDMGFIDQEVYDKYEKQMANSVRENLNSAGHFSHHETEEETIKHVQEFMASKIQLAPRMVMATLSEMGVIKIRAEWAEFVSSN